MKNKQVTALIAATVLIGCGVGAGIYISNNQVTITQTENRIDLIEGEVLDFHLEDFVEVSPESAIDKISVDASEVNTAEAGNYNIYLTYKDETYTVAVNVVAPVEETEEVETEIDADYMALMLSHVTNENGSYVMDDELAEVLMDLDIAKGATVDEVNWWLNQSDSAYLGSWLDAVCGTEDEQEAMFAEMRMWVLQDLGDELDYNIHDAYTKAHQSSSGSSNSSSNSSSSSSSNSSSSSSSGNSSSSSGDSSSNSGSSSSSTGDSSSNSSAGSDDGSLDGVILDGCMRFTDNGGTGGSSGWDGACINWR